MKYRLKVAVLLLSVIVTSSQLFAQTADTILHSKKQVNSGTRPFRTWSVGINTGISSTYTPLTSNKTRDFTSPNIQMSYGGYIKDQLTRSFGIQADFSTGKLQSDHAVQLKSNTAPIYSQFDTKLNWSASLSGNLSISNGKKGIVQEYVTLGAGLLNFTPVLHSYYKSDVLPAFTASTGLYIPLGVGVKFALAKGLNLDLGYQVNFFTSDKLDGYVYGSNDMFSYTHIGLEFSLGKSSKPQLARLKKNKSVHVEHIAPAKILKAHVVAQSISVDSTQIRHDLIKADLDSANAKLARLNFDSDGDGVPDVKDKCPNTPNGIKVDSAGCPVIIPIVKTNVSPEVTGDDRATVKTAIKELEFFPGTSIIHAYSLNGLDKVAELLKGKKMRLRLEGYTDSAGKPDDNLKLSKERAEAVRLYLVGRGVNPAQIETVGYGAAHPVASNKTPEGRRLNRRVEFVLL